VAQAGLQHRDIKPENVLFIGGEPALGDFGMATDDMTQVSMRGTPHHVAPSWYFESGGNSDQWGAAVLLYQLLTGNPPDKMGKPKYHKPAVGMGALSQEQQIEWKRLQSLVNRATSEVPGERFQGFDAFKKALIGENAPAEQRSEKKVLPLIGALFLVLVLTVYFWKHPSIFGVGIPSSHSSSKRSAGKNELPAILNQTNQPHNLSPEDVEQINQYNSSKAQEATDVAIKSLQETFDRLSNSKRTPVPDPTPK